MSARDEVNSPRFTAFKCRVTHLIFTLRGSEVKEVRRAMQNNVLVRTSTTIFMVRTSLGCESCMA